MSLQLLENQQTSTLNSRRKKSDTGYSWRVGSIIKVYKGIIEYVNKSKVAKSNSIFPGSIKEMIDYSINVLKSQAVIEIFYFLLNT